MSGNYSDLEKKKQYLFFIVEENINASNPEVFVKYINMFPDVDNIQDSNGKRLLEFAVECGNLNAVSILIERGADVDLANDKGETPLGISRSFKEREKGEEIFELLNERKKSSPVESNPSNNSEEENYELDVDNDTIEDVKRKLKVENGKQIKPKAVFNVERYGILHDFLKIEKFDVVDFLLDKTKLPLWLENKDFQTLADISWERRQYKFLVNLLEKDSEFPKDFDESSIVDNRDGTHDLRELVRLRKALHVNIRSGTLQSVKEISKELKCKMYMDTENCSALAVSLKEGQLEIYAYFVFIGADYKNHKEKSENFPKLEERKQLMSLLDKHNKRSQSSHLHKVLRKYQVVGKRSEELTKQFDEMFKAMDKSTLLQPLLKVLEYVKYSITFDVESEYVERTCIERLEGESEKNYGIVLPMMKSCYIGAKNFCSSDPERRKFIYSTLAHELCHLVATFLYENGGVPYESHDKKMELKYHKIVKEIEVKECDRHVSTDETQFKKLRKVFIEDGKLYENDFLWRSEVIVRCPEILAYYGDEDGRGLMGKYVPNVLKFYVENFIPDCEKFARNAFLIKPDSVLYEMSKQNGCLSKEEREVIPLESPVKFDDKLLRIKKDTVEIGKSNLMNLSLYLLKTKNITLCKLCVYQYLKDIHKFLVNRKCLFFRYNYFNENFKKLQEALKWEIFDDIIIVQDVEGISGFDNLIECLEKLECTEKKRVIFIVNEKFEYGNVDISDKIISFNWHSLSEELKDRLVKKTINFQGMEVMFCELFGDSFDKKALSADLISRLMNGKAIGEECYSEMQNFDDTPLIERTLIRNALDDFLRQMQNLKDIVFLTGIKEDEMIKIGFQKSNIKIVSKDQCKHYRLSSERIVLPDQMKDADDIFKIIYEKIKSKKGIHWIHYMGNKFIHIQSVGNRKERLKYTENIVREDELVNLSLQKETRAVLITDEPGSGKSTLLQKLSKLLKNKSPSTLVLKSSFSDIFSEFKKEDDWENIFIKGNSEEILDCFTNSICKGDPVVKELFRALCKLPMRVSIFLDAMDELPKDNIKYARIFLRELKKSTKSQIWVSSRTYYSKDLLMALGTVPHKLKLWDESDQCNYLCEFWTYSLRKCDLSKAEKKIRDIVEATTNDQQSIEPATYKLNIVLKIILSSYAKGNISSFHKKLEEGIFNDFAKNLLKNNNFTESIEFVGIPLHVFMIGNIIYNSNFSLMSCQNIFSLFSTFTEQKIDIFLKEKGDLTDGKDFCKSIIKERKESIIADHITIARKSFGFGNSDSLDLSKLKNYEYLSQIGLGNVIGNQFTFIHKTFEEYFYSLSIYEDMQIGKPDGKILKGILLNRELNPVEMFVNCALEKNMPKTIVESKFFTDINLRECIKKLFHSEKREDVYSHCIWIWKYIIFQLESQEAELMTKRFISCCKSDIEIRNNTFGFNILKNYNAFLVLLNFQKEKWKMEIFDLNDEFFEKVILLSFEYCSKNELYLIIKNIKYSISMKSNCDHCKDLCNIQTELGECSENHSSECLRKRLVKKLFEKKDYYDRNMMMFAIRNEHKNVFVKTIDFAKEMFGDKYKELLKAKDINGRGILYYIRKLMQLKNVLEILERHLNKNEIKDILLSKDDEYGIPDLWEVIQNVENNEMNEYLDYIRKYINDDDSYKSILLIKDGNQETILNHSVFNFNVVNAVIDEVLKLVDIKSVNGKKAFMEWINARVVDGYNIATWTAVQKDNEKLKEFINNLRKSLSDEKTLSIILFDGILLFEEYAVEFREKYNDYALMVFDYILSLIKDDRSLLNELILEHKDNEFGCNFMSIAFLRLDLRNIEKLIEKFRNEILNLNEMKKLFLQIDNEGNTILRYAIENEDVNVFSLVCDEIIFKLFNKNELKKLIMKSNDNGMTFLYFVYLEHKDIYIVFRKLKECIGIELITDLLLRVDNEKGNTCLHQWAQERWILPSDLEEYIKQISGCISKSDFEKLILTKNKSGRLFYYNILFSIYFLKSLLSEDSFKKLTETEDEEDEELRK